MRRDLVLAAGGEGERQVPAGGLIREPVMVTAMDVLMPPGQDVEV
ncbi:hypothetical protein [Microbispora rosea]|nr:hypothetical protein [Microbispora rosea]